MIFEVPGEPTGKGRPRVMKWGTYTPEKTVLYENLVKTCYDGPMMEGPLCMSVTAYYQIPKSGSNKKHDMMRSHETYPTKKPDCDNVLKIIADALNKIAYNDDSQIVYATVRKLYADVPRVVIQINPMDET